jgi:hypothetical protein
MKRTLFTVLAFMILNLLYGQEQTEKLDKILQRLDQVRTASYSSKSSSSAPGDTLAFQTYEHLVNMYANPLMRFQELLLQCRRLIILMNIICATTASIV